MLNEMMAKGQEVLSKINENFEKETKSVKPMTERQKSILEACHKRKLQEADDAETKEGETKVDDTAENKAPVKPERPSDKKSDADKKETESEKKDVKPEKKETDKKETKVV